MDTVGNSLMIFAFAALAAAILVLRQSRSDFTKGPDFYLALTFVLSVSLAELATLVVRYIGETRTDEASLLVSLAVAASFAALVSAVLIARRLLGLRKATHPRELRRALTSLDGERQILSKECQAQSRAIVALKEEIAELRRSCTGLEAAHKGALARACESTRAQCEIEAKAELRALREAHRQSLRRALDGRVELDAKLSALQTKEGELRRMNSMKDEFLAMVSHELRTPMNAIMGWTELLRHHNVEPDEMLEAYDVLHRNAKIQAKLIEDVLDVSRIISGKLKLQIKPVVLGEVVREAVHSMSLAAERKGVHVEVCYDGDAQATMRGDKDRLQQVIWNLLSNAVKFTPAGGHIRVAYSGCEQWAEVIVSDSGSGIEADFLPYVFERFLQEDSSRVRRYGGLGLGLSIARHIVDMHGGRIEAQSAGKNQGATFRVRFPLSVVDAQGSREQSASIELEAGADTEELALVLKGIHILFVEDEPDTRALLVKVLRRAGASVTGVGSAKDALAALQEKSVDVVISDIGMPGVDGYEFVRRFRKQHDGGEKPIPAIALTAYARKEDRRTALAAGFTEHISKPIDIDQLIATVAGLSDRATQHLH